MKKIITFGVFDYYHLGHLRVFKQCKTYAEYLIVAVQDGDYILKYKPEAKVLYSTEERREMIQSIKYVDEVIIYKDASPAFLNTVDFDVLALGEDHIADRWRKCEEWCKNNGKEVIRLKRTPNICSSDIKKDINEKG